MRRVTSTACVLLMIGFFSGAAIFAQSTKVELSGLVRDPSGLGITEADVRLLNVGTGVEQAGITTPFTTPFFPLIQTAGQRSLDNQSCVRAFERAICAAYES